MSSQNVQYLPQHTEMTVRYTGYQADDTTLVAADLAVGHVITAYGKDSDGTLKACRPQSSTFARPKFVVVGMPSDVNTLPYTATPTRRKGGLVKVVPLKNAIGYIDCLVNTGLSAGNTVGVTNNQFYLDVIADAAITTAGELGSRVGVITAATTSTTITPVLVGGL